ncbi:AAA family ATPase [Phaeobacter inhibens]|uniref:McrB family protein n=1 Tax=Phaeobacter inhibens TaxID=221822 RepID=UPI0021A5A247|nr:AAA family ATPase [Phaeobacter inhibens]UWR76648.1 AAA family ATPase [Phaeobacter inhibens]
MKSSFFEQMENIPLPDTNWGTPLRDVLTDADFQLELGEINKKLEGLLRSEGLSYKRPYSEIIKEIGGNISENRLETWKKFFQELGLLWVKDGEIAITEFGRILNSSHDSILEQLDRGRRNIAEAAVGVLGRQQLRNPSTKNRDYPEDCDVLPYRSIWLAIHKLGWLHWEELHRVILKVMRSDQLNSAIEKIESARSNTDYDPQDSSSAQKYLGDAVYSDSSQAARRMTPWFSGAGFGGLLIDREPNKGCRSFTDLGAALIPKELASDRTWIDFEDDQQAWIDYLNEAVLPGSKSSPETSKKLTAVIGEDDQVLIEAKKLLFDDQVGGVLFVGPPGTGKSWYARQVAIALSLGNADCIREVQFHPSYQYDDFVEGYAPDGEKGFKLVDRHLLQMSARARERDTPVVMVIDEFSRTDPARVLGETLTYMEGSMRDVVFHLPSGRLASIPSNLLFLATMNPEDRSVDEIDDAMDRRWAKIHLKPDRNKLKEFLIENGASGTVIGATLKFFSELQEHIEIGHAFFRKVKDTQSLERVWSTQIQHISNKRHRFDTSKQEAIKEIWEKCAAALSEKEEASSGEKLEKEQ